MATDLTEDEITGLRTMLAAFQEGQQVDDLPLATSSIQDKEIEVFDKTTGASGRMPIRDAVNMANAPYFARYWDSSLSTTKASGWVGSLDFGRRIPEELELFMSGERSVDKYRNIGINWWDYCGSILVNSYPTYFEKLPKLLEKINREKRPSKNYVLFLGETNAESNQAPCLSLVQFQIEDGELVITAYQRSSDASLGLPSDIYHLYLMSRQVDIPLKSITLFLGNVHIYENNISSTVAVLSGESDARFQLNV